VKAARLRNPIIIVSALFAGSLPVQATPIDAKTVRLFLAACAKESDACMQEISDQVLAEADGDMKASVCLSDDMRDAPIMISRAMMIWLKTSRPVAGKPPAEAIAAGAKILYPCNP
jgi:hypothetical protein